VAVVDGLVDFGRGDFDALLVLKLRKAQALDVQFWDGKPRGLRLLLRWGLGLVLLGLGVRYQIRKT